MVERGTYSEFLKSGVDIFSLFEKGNEQSEPSAVPGTPTVISESLVQSLQSPRPSLKDAAPEDQEVSFSFCSVSGSVCSWWSHGPSVCSARDIFICPKVDPNVPKVLFHGIGRVRRAWGEQACLGFPFGVGWRILWRSVVGALLKISEWMWLTLIENSSVYHGCILLMLVAPGFPYASRGLMWRPP